MPGVLCSHCTTPRTASLLSMQCTLTPPSEPGCPSHGLTAPAGPTAGGLAHGPSALAAVSERPGVSLPRAGARLAPLSTLPQGGHVVARPRDGGPGAAAQGPRACDLTSSRLRRMSPSMERTSWVGTTPEGKGRHVSTAVAAEAPPQPPAQPLSTCSLALIHADPDWPGSTFLGVLGDTV